MVSTFFKKRPLWLIVLLAPIWLAACASQAPLPEKQAEQLYHPISEDLLPSLSHSGQHTVGVKTLTITNPEHIKMGTGEKSERSLVLEMWYPSTVDVTTASPLAEYNNVTRLGTPFSVQGTAYRDSPIIEGKQSLPLIVLSHGYTGYRTLMFYLGEHLASHGYIVAAIDHTDSTNADVDMLKSPGAGFPSTLYNRARDQQLTLDYLTKENTFISSHIDPHKAGLVGYSMGGYGALNTLGACYRFTEDTIAAFTGVSDTKQSAALAKLLNSCAGGQHQGTSADPRWQAALAIAPWGNQHKVFDEGSIANIKTPLLYIAGEHDDISDYSSIQDLFEKTGGKDTYLLTYFNARHNIAAHPAPKAALNTELEIGHYFEPAWDSQQLNAINKHFALAMMDCHIKQKADACVYLQLKGNSNQAAKQGEKSAPWPGFAERYSIGMGWNHKQ